MTSGKISKYDNLTGKAILSSDQRRVIEQANITNSPFDKVLEKQTKTINDQGRK